MGHDTFAETSTISFIIFITALVWGLLSLLVPFFIFRIRNETIKLNTKLSELIKILKNQAGTEISQNNHIADNQDRMPELNHDHHETDISESTFVCNRCESNFPIGQKKEGDFGVTLCVTCYQGLQTLRER